MNNPGDLAHIVRKGLTAEIEKIIEQEAIQAARIVETRVRETTAQVACRILDNITFEKCGAELVIRVSFNKP